MHCLPFTELGKYSGQPSLGCCVRNLYDHIIFHYTVGKTYQKLHNSCRFVCPILIFGGKNLILKASSMTSLNRTTLRLHPLMIIPLNEVREKGFLYFECKKFPKSCNLEHQPNINNIFVLLLCNLEDTARQAGLLLAPAEAIFGVQQ